MGTKRGRNLLHPPDHSSARGSTEIELSNRILLNRRKMGLHHNCIGSYQQRVILERIKQTRLLLRMFSGVVIVFIMFVTPAQLLWILKDFSALKASSELEHTVYIIIYANSIFNPWIYGGLNRTIRRDMFRLYNRMKSDLLSSLRF